jgi:hypothetical protein
VIKLTLDRTRIEALRRKIASWNLDYWIYNLVLVLNYLGVETTDSCEGHSWQGPASIPSVSFKTKYAKKLRPFIEKWNQTHPQYLWHIYSLPDARQSSFLQPQEPFRPLDVMHREANALAKFILNEVSNRL